MDTSPADTSKRGDHTCRFSQVVIMLLYLDFLQHMLFRAADIRIRKLKWRGLWMTKQIEGTVDDDVAVKLAIGEGRQADLEQERLELQALNSERFRHRFLERNRPWILQHLVELLTPRSLEQPGHDGRPVVEYVRDVYAELMVRFAASLSSCCPVHLRCLRAGSSRRPPRHRRDACSMAWRCRFLTMGPDSPHDAIATTPSPRRRHLTARHDAGHGRGHAKAGRPGRYQFGR